MSDVKTYPKKASAQMACLTKTKNTGTPHEAVEIAPGKWAAMPVESSEPEPQEIASEDTGSVDEILGSETPAEEPEEETAAPSNGLVQLSFRGRVTQRWVIAERSVYTEDAERWFDKAELVSFEETGEKITIVIPAKRLAYRGRMSKLAQPYVEQAEAEEEAVA